MRFFRLLMLVLLIGCIFAGQAARFLVVEDPQKSDAIVVLAGDTGARPLRGLELLRQGMAPRLFLDAEAPHNVYGQQLSEIAQKYLNTLPEAHSTSVCPVYGHSTSEETRDVLRCLQPWNIHRVLLVTSDYHTRRARLIFSHSLPQYQWSIAGARDPIQFGTAWWTHREWAKMTFDEWAKLVWWEAVDRWR